MKIVLIALGFVALAVVGALFIVAVIIDVIRNDFENDGKNGD